MKILLSLSIAILGISANLIAAPVKIHRVRPLPGTEQYAREAERTHIELISTQLGLSEKQIKELKKITDKRISELKKLKGKELKAQKEYDSEIEKLNRNRQKVNKKYSESLRGIIDSAKYSQFEEILRELVLDVNPSSNVESDSSATKSQGGIDKIVKAPNPPIMYE